MRLRNKILLTFLIIILVLIGSVAGAILYCYYRPSAVKLLLEKSISQATASSFTIQELSYSIRPLRILARGINLKPLDNEHGLHLQIRNLMADVGLTGPFGKKTLTINKTKIDGLSINLIKDIGLPQITLKREDTSFVSQVMRRALSLFVFEDVHFEEAELNDGYATAKFEDQTIEASGIRANIDAEHRVCISFALQVIWPSQGASLTLPQLDIVTDHAISLVDPKMRISIAAPKGAFESSKVDVKASEVKANLSYDHNRKTLAFQPMDLDFKGMMLKIEPGKQPIPFNLSLKAQGSLNLQDSHLDAPYFHLEVEDRLQLKGGLNLALGPKASLGLEDIEFSLFPERILPLLPYRIRAVLAPFNFEGQLNLHGGMDESKKRKKLKATLMYDRNRKKLTLEPMHLHLDGVTIRHESWKETVPLKVSLKTEGPLNLQGRHIDAPLFHLEISDILQLKGGLKSVPGVQTSVRLERMESLLFPEKILPVLSGGINGRLQPFRLSGPVRIQGDLSGKRDQKKWTWDSDLQAHLKQNTFSYTTPQVAMKGRLTGSLEVKGRIPRVTLSVKMEADNMILSRKGMELTPIKASLSLAGGYPVYEIKDLAARLPKATVAIGKRAISIDDIELTVQGGNLDIEKKSFVLPVVRLDSSWLRNLMLAVEVDADQSMLQLLGKDTNLIGSALALNLLPPGWQVRGSDFIEVRAILKPEGRCSMSSALGFQGLGFENADASAMGEKISVDVKLSGDLDLRARRIAANTTIEIHGGEVLYDRFYMDLAKNRFFSSGEFIYDLPNKSLHLSKLWLGFKDILTLHMNGSVTHNAHNPRLLLSLSVPKAPLKPAFQHFVLEPFKTEKPFLRGLGIAGDFSADISLTHAAADWAIAGHCRWHKGEVSIEDDALSLEGIDLDLPMWYRYSVTSDESRVTSSAENTSSVTHGASSEAKPLKGSLAIQSVRLPLLPEQSLKLPLEAGPNRLSVSSSTPIRVPGGKIRLGPVACLDIFTSKPSIKTSLSLDAIDLNPFLSMIWSRPVQGIIQGKLDPIQLEGNTLSSLGQVTAKVFGGEIVLSDLGISGALTDAQAFKLNAMWGNLSLAEITNDTAFGKVQGILKGHVKDLEIAYGQPQGFDLLLETVKKKGVPQKISVKAVENISRIGGGRSPFAGMAGALASFFREFPYEKIGVRATLKNDVFRINGTIHQEGREYLVKKGGISGVNVVNQNPDNRISFKDMVKRIQRITASRSGPVIK